MGEVFLRTIYIWNALALFARNTYGTYIKPTEGISEHAWRSIRRLLYEYEEGKEEYEGGFWIWICSSKETDIETEKKSYIFGAVYVTGIMLTSLYKKRYNSNRVMDQFSNSSKCKYQLIIPMHEYARVELLEPIVVHDVEKGENRQGGVWEANEGTVVYQGLKNARFV